MALIACLLHRIVRISLLPTYSNLTWPVWKTPKSVQNWPKLDISVKTARGYVHAGNFLTLFGGNLRNFCEFLSATHLKIKGFRPELSGMRVLDTSVSVVSANLPPILS